MVAKKPLGRVMVLIVMLALSCPQVAPSHLRCPTLLKLELDALHVQQEAKHCVISANTYIHTLMIMPTHISTHWCSHQNIYQHTGAYANTFIYVPTHLCQHVVIHARICILTKWYTFMPTHLYMPKHLCQHTYTCQNISYMRTI